MRFEVWALGFDRDDFCTDVEEFLGSFSNKIDAINHAKKFKDISYIYDQTAIQDYLQPGDYFEIRVESVQTLPDGISENINTVYSDYIYIPKA